MVGSQDQPTPALNDVLSRALVDDDFREQLFADRETALGEYELSAFDKQFLDSVPKSVLDRNAESLREESVVGAMIGIGIGGHFGVAEGKPEE
jgi:hypothetical protein